MSSKVGEYIRAHVLGLLAILIALSGTAVAGQRTTSGDGPKASASVVTDAKFKKLKKRVAALERKAPPTIPTTLPPSGPAGGVLDGTFPNPGLANDSVGAAEIAQQAVTGSELFRSTGTITDVPAVAGETCVGGPSVSVPGILETHHIVTTPPAGFPATFTLTGVPDVANDQADLQICNHFTGGGSADPDGPAGGIYKVAIIEFD